MTYLFPILLVAMGIYVLYGAIAGKGRLFALDNIKEEARDKVHKILRILYFALAAIMLLMAVANFGQTVLYSQRLTDYEATAAYTEDFSDIIKDGCVEYENNKYVVEGRHDYTEMSAIIQAAYTAHPEKFSSGTSQSMFSCGGSTTDPSAKYYKVIEITDADGKNIFISTLGSVRSDANDGSFVAKMYGMFSETFLRVVSYVFMGLAIVGIASLFLILRKFTDKEKEAKARAQATGQAMPSSAFDFDDEEKKS